MAINFYKAAFVCFWVLKSFILNMSSAHAQEVPPGVSPQTSYAIGVGDILEVNVLQPEALLVDVVVAPDGTITFPYIGQVEVQGKTLTDVQNQIQQKLSEGYMHYPVVSVALKESNSRRFFVYGEVEKPGTFTLESGTTVLKAISMAGGLTKFASSGKIKVLRPKQPNGSGYDNIKINLKAVMEGATQQDVPLEPGDIIVVSEGAF